MTVTTSRSINKDMPHADIYRNDLWEIEEYFRNSYLSFDNQVTVSFSYRADDLEITTREELLAHGGRVTKFALETAEVSSSRTTRNRILTYNGILNPRLDVPYSLCDTEWELQGRVNAIFTARQKVWKTFLVNLPRPIVNGISLSILLIAYLSRHLSIIYLAFLLAFAACLPIGYGYGLFSKNWVYLQNSRDDERARTAKKSERIEKLAWLLVAALVGALLGVACTLFTTHYKH